jgi:two-component system, sensor histidine kinase PdtaS
MWKKTLPALVLFLTCLLSLKGQSQSPVISGPATVNSYSISQKRLLVISTAQFINSIAASDVDKDSIMAMAHRITGLSFLLPYNEGFEKTGASAGADLLNAGSIAKAIQLLNTLKGEQRIQLLIELGIWYLHKTGTRKTDLDSANHYIQEALAASSVPENSHWRYECLKLLAEYYDQSGNALESKKTFLQIVSSSQREGDSRITAYAWQHLGELNLNGDSSNLAFLNNSLVLYQQLHLKEKEMELLWAISELHDKSDAGLEGKDLLRILTLQQATGYKHTLYAEYTLSYTNLLQANSLDALNHANVALANMKWSGFAALSATFHMRVGVTYWALGKKEEALTWFKKGLENRTNETHLFWYKSLFYAGTILGEMNRPEEALALIQTVTREFPPLTPFEKAQVVALNGWLYQKQNKPRLADENYMALLELSNRYPLPAQEFAETYWDVASFYVSRSNAKLARLFLAKAMENKRYEIIALYRRYYLLFQIDSLTGNYESAMQNYIQYKFFYDSTFSMDQRKKLDELTVKYGAEKKDQDIKLLTQQDVLQKIESGKNKQTRNIMIAVSGLLLIIVGLLFSRYKLKQRTTKKLEIQQKEIEQQNLSLRNLVTEKDWLVKEIHHRVKNNFQTVMGLLGTQSGYLSNEVAIGAITDSQHRIHAMSLIHQKLYQTDNMSAINMPDYIHELVDYLRDSYTIGNRIRFNLHIDRIELELSHCIPLGLILNEAITNSFKYAFPGDRKGIIAISLRADSANRLLLTIKDNGPGLPAGFSDIKSDSMGMNLMRGLSREIDAQFTIGSQNGTQIAISFVYAPDIIIGITQMKTEPTHSI